MAVICKKFDKWGLPVRHRFGHPRRDRQINKSIEGETDRQTIRLTEGEKDRDREFERKSTSHSNRQTERGEEWDGSQEGIKNQCLN